jgi:hypothetical protein
MAIIFGIIHTSESIILGVKNVIIIIVITAFSTA